MFYPRHIGRFIDRDNRYVYEVRILEDADTPPPVVGNLAFAADEPLVIEREECEVHDPLCGSIATLRILSPSDRAYEDLYTIRPGRIRLEVYRVPQNAADISALYWCGTLDAEFYEEPYDRMEDYEVSLTFSDFGILSRLPFALDGRPTLGDILEGALTRAGLGGLPLDCSLVSTVLADGRPLTLDALAVRADNFYDEDGEPASLRDALKAILQPLALRIVQYAGTLWVYDLHALHTLAPTTPVRWMGEDQMLSAERVYNNIKVTLSTYADAAVISDDFEYLGETSADVTHVPTVEHPQLAEAGTDAAGHPGVPDPEADDYRQYATIEKDAEEIKTTTGDTALLDRKSFNIFFSDTATRGIVRKGRQARYFKTVPLYGGEEAEGIASCVCPIKVSNRGKDALEAELSVTALIGHAPWPSITPGDETEVDPYVLVARSRYIPPIAAPEGRSAPEFCLVLRQEMLLDVRYNYTEQASEYNDKYLYDQIAPRMNIVEIPCEVVLLDDEGSVTHHLVRGSNTGRQVSSIVCHWEEGAPSERDYYEQPNGKSHIGLVYFDYSDLAGTTAVMKWATNRNAVQPHDTFAYGVDTNGALTTGGKHDGLRIPYPTSGGTVEVRLLDGVRAWNVSSATRWHTYSFYARWLLFKAPTLTICRNDFAATEASTDDIEYTGVINPEAKDDLTLGTIVGTAAEAMPTARALLIDATTGLHVRTLSRAGRTTTAEQLLIGTCCSQYADRRTRLSGTARLDDGGTLATYRDEAQPEGRRFILAAAVEDLRAATAEISLVELHPDRYDSL